MAAQIRMDTTFFNVIISKKYFMHILTVFLFRVNKCPDFVAVSRQTDEFGLF